MIIFSSGEILAIAVLIFLLGVIVGMLVEC